MKRRIKIQGFLIFLSLMFSILLSKFLFPKWKRKILDEFLDAIGIVIVLSGFLLRISARGYKSEKSCEGKNLITDGPYGLMRHPMYFGTFLIGLGIIALLFNWWLLPLFLLIFLLIYVPQVHREEEKLSRQFGSSYKVYSQKTPKYFPKIISLFKLDFRDYLPFRWQYLKKEIISLIAVISLIILIETWEDVRAFGRIEYREELLELFLIIVSYFIVLTLLSKKD